MNRFVIAALLLAQQVTPQCGSSGSSTPRNMVPLTLNTGPTQNAFNVAFLTLNICPPGQTTNCQAISGVMVDTGSTGLRILSSVLTVPLTQQTTSSGAGVVECFPFQDGFTWGPVANANIQIGSELASNVPIQLIGSNSAPAPPDSCTSGGGPPENTLDTLGANGILGIGLFRQDCGPACTFSGGSNPGLYYGCAGSNCQITPQTLTQQLQNPVWMFSADNNGVVLELPVVPAAGQLSSTGLLLFGIGTQSNNGLGGATIFRVDGNGNMTTRYGASTTPGFLDSGSNGYYFLDSPTTGIPTCPDTANFYCPAATLSLSATNLGANGTSGIVAFNIANADPQLNNPDALLPQIGGPFAGYFDWGLNFFYGRTVFTAIESQSTPGGIGPYFAY